MCDPMKDEQSAQIPTPDSALNLYKVYREYIMQESALINSRLMWVLTINGFLFTTYGFTVQKELEISNSGKFSAHHTPWVSKYLSICYGLSQSNQLLKTLAVAGFLVSSLGLLAILAAQIASGKVERLFRTQNMQGLKFRNYKLPALRGGGARGSVLLAYSASIIIPVIFVLAWVYAFAEIQDVSGGFCQPH